MYKYETHLHTKHGSACATISGKGQALEYKHAGYTGIIITEHFFRGNTCIPKDLTWEERINLFCRGYEEAKYYGDKIGLQVFFGWEETYDGQDFLVYGLDKEWLLNHPEVENMVEWLYMLTLSETDHIYQKSDFFLSRYTGWRCTMQEIITKKMKEHICMQNNIIFQLLPGVTATIMILPAPALAWRKGLKVLWTTLNVLKKISQNSCFTLIKKWGYRTAPFFN